MDLNAKPQHSEGWLQATLAEYATLRAEILQRATVQTQICTVAGTVTVVIAGISVQKGTYELAVLLLPLVAFFLLTGLKFVDRDTKACASRIIEIERAVNEHLSEETMVWEQRHGLGAIGYLGRWMQVFDLNSNKDTTRV